MPLIKRLFLVCTEIEKTPEDKYPTVVFLGTSSATPSKYRNVSAYLLQLNEECNIFIDCGEGTYGQLRVLYGPNECEQILTNLKALFITHAHQDHMNGLYLLIVKRIEAFKKRGLNFYLCFCYLCIIFNFNNLIYVLFRGSISTANCCL